MDMNLVVLVLPILVFLFCDLIKPLYEFLVAESCSQKDGNASIKSVSCWIKSVNTCSSPEPGNVINLKRIYF